MIAIHDTPHKIDYQIMGIERPQTRLQFYTCLFPQGVHDECLILPLCAVGKDRTSPQSTMGVVGGCDDSLLRSQLT